MTHLPATRKLGLAPFLLALLAAIAAFVGWLAFERAAQRKTERDLAERREREVERTRVESVGSAPADEARAAASETASAPALPVSPKERVAIHGRLVLANGAPARSGVVALRTGIEEIDYADLLERVRGAKPKGRFAGVRSGDPRVRALGGWKKSFETAARDDGTFELRVPRRITHFTLVARADGAVYDRDDPFDLSPGRLADGITLVLDPAGSIEGTVTAPDGRPIAGALVHAESSDRWAQERYALADAVMFLDGYRDLAFTDAEGRYSFPAVVAGTDRWTVSASADGLRSAQRDEVKVAAGTATRVDLQLESGLELEGTVVDEDGSPVAGAAVTARTKDHYDYSHDRTDSRGRFRLRALFAGAHRIVVEHDSLLPARDVDDGTQVEVPAPPGAPPLAIALARGHHVAGRVVDRDGRAMAGVELDVATDWRPLTDGAKHKLHRAAVSDADGKFRAVGLPDGPFTISATLEDHAVVEQAEIPADSDAVVVTIPAPTGISGRVVEAASGRPIESFFVLATLRLGLDFGRDIERESAKAFSSKDGSFALLGLAPGTYDLTVRAGGYVGGRFGEAVVVTSGAVTPIAPTELEPAAIVRGHVVDAANGEPLGRASASVDVSYAGSAEARWSARAYPMADGSFEVRDVPPGMVSVGAIDDEHTGAKTETREARAGSTVEFPPLALARGGAIEGTIRSRDGARVLHSPLTAERQGPVRQAKSVWVRGNASFRIGGLTPGTWRIEIQEGGPPLRAEAVVVDGATTTVVLEASDAHGCKVTGRVVCAGAPIAGADVHVCVQGGDRRRAESRGLRTSVNARTDADGAFSMDDVPPGEGHLLVSRDRTRVERRVTIPDEPRHTLEIELPAGTRISGRVVRKQDGSPVAGASVRAYSWAGGEISGSQAETESGADGSFALEGLPAGRCRLAASVPLETVEPLAEAWADVDVSADATAHAELAMEIGARLVVEAIGVDGTPAAGAHVVVKIDGDPFAYVKTDAKGFARIDRLRPGACVVTASMARLPNATSEPVRLEAGGSARAKVQFRSGSTLNVRVVGSNGEAVEIWSVVAIDAAGRAVGGWTPAAGVPIVLGVPRGKLRIEASAEAGEGSTEVEIGDAPIDEVVVRVGAKK